MKSKITFLLFNCFLVSQAQVGINTNTPGSTLDVNGSFATPYKQVTTSTYSLLVSDQYLDYRGTAVSTWSLPAAQTSPNFKGRIYEIRNESGFNIVLTPNGTEKIDVSNTQISQPNFLLPSGYYAIVKSTGNTTGSTWVVTMLSNGLAASGSTGGNTTGFSSSILGYIPVNASLRTVPSTFNGTSVTELGCKKWTGAGSNGHTYCAYQLGAGTTFYNSFSLAKQIGGYIVTLPSSTERLWVYNNILATGPNGYNLNNNIWIGYNKVAYPGNSNEFTWITGENWVIDWTTSPNSTPQGFFAGGEPNNAGGTEGSCHIHNVGTNAAREWNDLPGSSTSSNGVNFDQIILEFNQD